MYAGRTQKGRYEPRNPQKYVGDITKIRYMSSWEKEAHQFFDNNPNIIHWSSEGIKIPYIKPTDGKIHHYYPDYWIEYKNRNGEIVQEIIEVKPATQTKPPSTKGKRKKQQIYESITWAVNVAKWKACQDFCNKYNIKFRIITENHMFK
jgi:TnsA endonuclease N terminal